MRIAVVGDCTLDVIVRPADGPMPDGPVRAGGDAAAQIRAGAGGQGANVAVRLARAGVPARLACPLADDLAGNLLRAHLAQENVEVAALPAPRTAAVVVLVGPGAERTMLSDRIPLQGDLGSALAGAEWVHLSGYALREPREAEAVVRGVHRAGVSRVSVGGGSYEGQTDAGIAREAIDALRVALLVVNREEAERLAGSNRASLGEAASALATPDRLAVVTDGPRGAAAAGLTLEAPVICPPSAVAAIDATGAGDALTAELLARLLGTSESAWPPQPEAISVALSAAVAAGGRAAEALGAQTA